MTRRNKPQKNRISNVRVVDQNAGNDGLYVDRCIGELQNSHSQITMLLQDTNALTVTPTVGAGNIAGPQIALFDDFASLAQQFETFRIRAIRYDIYDVNPSVPIVGWFSTFHDEFGAAAQPVFNQAAVIDGPDSSIVPPGTGKMTLYWRAHGTNENRFVTTDQASVTFPPSYFGGLRFSYGNSSTSSPKFQVVTKALVDFRGRI